MKVLWLTNTPCSADEVIGHVGYSGGWQISLEKELNKDPNIDLHISFVSYSKLSRFENGRTTFHPVFRPGMKNKFKRLFTRVFGANYSEGEILSIKNIIEELQPDIIHIHGTEENFISVAGHITEIPVVVSIQGLTNSIKCHYFADTESGVISRYEGLRNKLFGIGIRKTFRTFKNIAQREKLFLDKVRYLIGRTEYDRLIGGLLAPGSHYFHSDEILREKFYTNVWQNKSLLSKIKIITTLSGKPYKGFSLLARTAKELNESNIEYEWHIIGLSANSDYVKVVSNALNEKFDNRLIFHGRQTADGVLSLIKDANIYVQTSHIENSSNALCEAQLLGIPCIASNVGGTSSLMVHKHSGYLYQNNDSVLLASIIKEAIHNWEDFVEYGHNIRQVARKRHDKVYITDQLKETYNKIVSLHDK